MTFIEVTSRGPFVLAAAVVFLLSGVSTVSAATGIRTFYIDEPAMGETGYKIEADWSQTGPPVATWEDGSPVTLGDPPKGFVLLDGTLEIKTDIPDGQMKLQVRMSYKRAELRALGWNGKRHLRMVRRKRHEERMIWSPIREVIRLRGSDARIKYGVADFTLGHYGTDLDNEYVWAVIDAPGTFAIGVPEPASLLCFVGGVGVLALRMRRAST